MYVGIVFYAVKKILITTKLAYFFIGHILNAHSIRIYLYMV